MRKTFSSSSSSRSKPNPFVLFTLLLLVLVVYQSQYQVICQTTTQKPCMPATLPPGGRWVPKANCVGAYNTGTEKCHCWGTCGYICQPLSNSTSSPGTGTGTCQTQNQNGPTTLGNGQEWVPAPDCPFGPVFQRPADAPTERCHCWGYCGYVCGPYVP